MLGSQQQLILLVENKEKYMYLYVLRGCLRPLRIVPLNNLCCAAWFFLITPIAMQCLLFFDTFCQIFTPLAVSCCACDLLFSFVSCRASAFASHHAEGLVNPKVRAKKGH
jgi:hypothetical protein